MFSTPLPAIGALCFLLSTLDMRASALSYGILLCHVGLISLGGLFFSKEEAGGGSGSGKGRSGRGSWKVREEKRLGCIV